MADQKITITHNSNKQANPISPTSCDVKQEDLECVCNVSPIDQTKMEVTNSKRIPDPADFQKEQESPKCTCFPPSSSVSLESGRETPLCTCFPPYSPTRTVECTCMPPLTPEGIAAKFPASTGVRKQEVKYSSTPYNCIPTEGVIPKNRAIGMGPTMTLSPFPQETARSPNRELDPASDKELEKVCTCEPPITHMGFALKAIKSSKFKAIKSSELKAIKSSELKAIKISERKAISFTELKAITYNEPETDLEDSSSVDPPEFNQDLPFLFRVSKDPSATYTIQDMLQLWACKDPMKPAFVFRGEGKTRYNRQELRRMELMQLACAFCRQARDLDIKPGDVVCNTLPSSPERVITDLGLMMAGAVVLSGVVFLADGSDLFRCVQKGECTAIVLDPTKSPSPLSLLQHLIMFHGNTAKCRQAPKLQRLFQIECGNGVTTNGRPWLQRLRVRLGVTGKPVEEIGRKLEDVTYIFTSTSSRGFTKLVPRTFGQLVSIYTTFYKDVLKYTPNDVLFDNRPLGQLGSSTFCYLVGGVKRVMTDYTTLIEDPVDFLWKAVYKEKCTVLSLYAYQITASINRPYVWRGIDMEFKPRLIISAGRPLTRSQAHAAGALSKEIRSLLCTQEAGYVLMNTITEKNKEKFSDWDYGCPLPGYYVRLLNSKDKVIPPNKFGKSGVLYVCGPQLYSGDKSDCINDVCGFTDDGWFCTNTVAFYNPAQHIHFVCKLDNAIYYTPLVLYPPLIEEHLERCPSVAKAIVVPVPDSSLCQEMCACVIPVHPEMPLHPSEIQDYFQDMFIPDSENKIALKYVLEFDDFPLTRVGHQPDRKKIFEKALERLYIS